MNSERSTKNNGEEADSFKKSIKLIDINNIKEDTINLFKRIKKTRYFVFVCILTIVLIIITITILSILPKTSIIGIKVYSQAVNFTIPNNNDGNKTISLSNTSSLWTSSIKINNFQPFKIVIDSFLPPIKNLTFKNPLIISPDLYNSHILISSLKPNISLQEIKCAPGANISFSCSEKNIFKIQIDDSKNILFLRYSLADSVTVLLQECKVLDILNNDLTEYFNKSITLKLHDYSKSINFKGENGAITATFKDSELLNKSNTLIYKQKISNLNFFKKMSQKGRIHKKSLIDSISIIRSFPFDDSKFKFTESNEIELECKPNRFYINSLKKNDKNFEIYAQGKFNSFKIVRGIREAEMIPAYISFIIQNPIFSLLIAWIAWIVSTILPLIYRRSIIMLKEKNEIE